MQKDQVDQVRLAADSQQMFFAEMWVFPKQEIATSRGLSEGETEQELH